MVRVMTIDRTGGPGGSSFGPAGGGGSAMESLTGRLLVATPALRDPNFERTVVLLVAHEEGGALGVVLNRATEGPVADGLEGWAPLPGEAAGVCEGGPGPPGAARCRARRRAGGRRVRGGDGGRGSVGGGA